LPSALLVLADNQRDLAANLAAAGSARLAGDDLAADLRSLVGDAAARERMSTAARRLVDGKGAARVAGAMLAVASPRLAEPQGRVRPVAEDDALDVWRLANEAGVRANSFKQEPIPLDGHMGWFRAQLARRDARFWAVEAGGTLAAQVRYVRDG